MLESICESREELLGQAANDYFEAIARGEQPSLDEFAERYPTCAEDLKQLFPALALVAESTAGGLVNARQHEGLARDLGDYRIVREVGRGGMGIVYEAEQVSLGRRVALKVLPFAAVMDEKAIARFKNEARAAATLEHPNIVPVFAVGNERGVYYYAMAFIEGRTLAEVIAAMRQMKGLSTDATSPVDASSAGSAPPIEADTAPTALVSTLPEFSSREYFRSVARLGIQAAEALHHAHERGIVHRDIKPGNLMLDPSGKLWITDFGLARIESDAGMTMTGDLLGTLRYMAPEQALGQRVVDQRADIYSLGVTLYELFALQPAYNVKDRRTLLHQIAFEEPKALRKLNSATTRDIETIVAKSCAKDPEDRYASATALADDLLAYLESRPVKATAPSIATSLAKWSKRHVAVVWGLIALLTMGVICLTAATTIVTSALTEASQQRSMATRHRRVAEDNLTLARDALEYFIDIERRRQAVGNQVVISSSGSTQLPPPEFWANVLTLYRDLDADNRLDPQSQLSLAVWLSETADIYTKYGDDTYRDLGFKVNDLAQSLADHYVADHPFDEEGLRAQCRALNVRIEAMGARQEWLDALAHIHLMVECARSWSSAIPESGSSRAWCSAGLQHLAEADLELGRLDSALSAATDANEEIGIARQLTPNSTWYVWQSLTCRELMSRSLIATGHKDEGLRLCREAAEEARRHILVNHDDAAYLQFCALLHSRAGMSHWSCGEYASAADLFSRASEYWRSLNDVFGRSQQGELFRVEALGFAAASRLMEGDEPSVELIDIIVDIKSALGQHQGSSHQSDMVLQFGERRITELKQQVQFLEASIKRSGSTSEQTRGKATGIRVRSAGINSSTDMQLILNSAQSCVQGGNFVEAESLARQALHLARVTEGKKSMASLAALEVLLSAIGRQSARDPEALRLSRHLLQVSSEMSGAASHRTVQAAWQLSYLQRATGNHAEALSVARRVVDARAQAFGMEHPQTLEVIGYFALLAAEPMWQRTSLREEALQLLRQSIEAVEAATASHYGPVLEGKLALGKFYEMDQLLQEAEEVYRSIDGVARRTEDQEIMANVKFRLGLLLEIQGRTAEAIPILRTLADWPENPSAEPWHSERRHRALLALARCLASESHIDEATKYHALSLKYAQDDIQRLNARLDLCHIHLCAKTPADAEQLARELLPLCKKVVESYDEALQPELTDQLRERARQYIIMAMWDQSRYSEARPWVEESCDFCMTHLGADDPRTLRNLTRLVWLLSEGQLTEPEKLTTAIPQILEIVEYHRSALGDDDVRTLEACSRLGRAYLFSKDYRNADDVFASLLPRCDMSLGAEHPITVVVRYSQGLSLFEQERYAEALPLLEASVRCLKTNEVLPLDEVEAELKVCRELWRSSNRSPNQ